MSGLLSSLVGAATAALNLRPVTEPAARGQAATGAVDAAFASALSAALAPRQRTDESKDAKAPASEPDAEDAGVEGEQSALTIPGSGVPVTPAKAGDQVAGTALVTPGSGVPRNDVGFGSVTPAKAGDQIAGTALVTAGSGVRRNDDGLGPVTPAKAGDQVAGTEPVTLDSGVPRNDGGVAAVGPGPTHVTNTMGELNAEFRTRLNRVINRMESEFGHEVTVVETFRDQARQEHLYAQGRTRPGPVVTWTRSSNHTQGRAADLLVDGTYDNPLAMVRLARVAREEGLRTLGGRDPGHVELPGGARVERLVVGADPTGSLLEGAAARHLDPARPSVPAQAGGLTRMAGLAQVAQVANVAQVAQVATVAWVATPGSIGRGAIEAPVAPAVVPEQPATAMAGQLAGSRGDSSQGDGRREGRSSNREPVMEASGDALPRVATTTPFGLENRGASATTADIRAVPGAFGAEAAERIARVLQLQDAAPSRPLSQMVLRLDNAAGGEDRIRVDLRGTSVGASLSLGDPIAAARMQSELGQLRKALESRGLQAEHLSVANAIAGRELVDALRPALPADPGQRAAQDPSSRREAWNERSGSRSGEAGSENPRQRSRKDPQQGRNT